MSEARRTVRATGRFFEDVDRQFPSERGPKGEPSANDFEVFELLRIVETFATRFDELPELIQGRHDYRILISQGMLVPVRCRRSTRSRRRCRAHPAGF